MVLSRGALPESRVCLAGSLGRLSRREKRAQWSPESARARSYLVAAADQTQGETVSSHLRYFLERDAQSGAGAAFMSGSPWRAVLLQDKVHHVKLYSERCGESVKRHRLVPTKEQQVHGKKPFYSSGLVCFFFFSPKYKVSQRCALTKAPFNS